jgi:hypothetical protein
MLYQNQALASAGKLNFMRKGERIIIEVAIHLCLCIMQDSLLAWHRV